MRSARVCRAMSQQHIQLLNAVHHTVSDEWALQISASSGYKHYNVIVSNHRTCSCTCHDYRVSHQLCKHLLYLLVRVVKETSIYGEVDRDRFQEYVPAIMNKLSSIFYSRGYDTATTTTTNDSEIKEEDDDNSSTNILCDCVICLTEVESQDELFTCTSTCKKPLGHIQCVQGWMKRNATCPLCRGHFVTRTSTSSSSSSSARAVEIVMDGDIIPVFRSIDD